jgi:phosphatidylserine decarboxylase
MVLACQGVSYLLLLAFLFYRDPERSVPQDSHVVLSPADGTVIYIRKVLPGAVAISEKKGKMLMLVELDQSSLKNREVWQVGISMVFTDVHVNRSPVSGKVTMVKHRPGVFLSLRDADAVGVNERQTMVIENKDFQIGIVQIASRLVRRIEAYVKEGAEVTAGQRIGMIKFGSQVDLFVPVEQVPALLVKEGQRLTAGVTPIGSGPLRATSENPSFRVSPTTLANRSRVTTE